MTHDSDSWLMSHESWSTSEYRVIVNQPQFTNLQSVINKNLPKQSYPVPMSYCRIRPNLTETQSFCNKLETVKCEYVHTRPVRAPHVLLNGERPLRIFVSCPALLKHAWHDVSVVSWDRDGTEICSIFCTIGVNSQYVNTSIPDLYHFELWYQWNFLEWTISKKLFLDIIIFIGDSSIIIGRFIYSWSCRCFWSKNKSNAWYNIKHHRTFMYVSRTHTHTHHFIRAIRTAFIVFGFSFVLVFTKSTYFMMCSIVENSVLSWRRDSKWVETHCRPVIWTRFTTRQVHTHTTHTLTHTLTHTHMASTDAFLGRLPWYDAETSLPSRPFLIGVAGGTARYLPSVSPSPSPIPISIPYPHPHPHPHLQWEVYGVWDGSEETRSILGSNHLHW